MDGAGLPAWLTALIGAIGATFATVTGAWFIWPKTKAEAELIEQQAEDALWARWQREIGRLEEIIRGQGRRIGELETQVRTLATSEIDLLKELAAKNARIAELEAMRAPVEIERRHPSAGGVSAALRTAHPPPHDVEGEAMKATIAKVRREGEKP